VRVVLKQDIYHDRKEARDNLMKGKIVRVYITEHPINQDEKYGWYLVDTGVEMTGIYNSDAEVDSGSIIRTFRDSELPDDYRRGPYQWINQDQAHIYIDNNEGAKYLLKKYEWSVE
jgi:hypothetical protein